MIQFKYDPKQDCERQINNKSLLSSAPMLRYRAHLTIEITFEFIGDELHQYINENVWVTIVPRHFYNPKTDLNLQELKNFLTFMEII